MIVSFVPMLLIASAYNYMNKADPDCGTSFAWVTRAMGPQLGWITGWVIEQTGWYTFFLLCTVLALPGMALLLRVAPWNERTGTGGLLQ